MNLWFRLFWYLVFHSWRRKLDLPEQTSKLNFRVWPLDLDTSVHLNNGRYLTLMDQGRLDLMVGGGLVGAVVSKGWTPITNAIIVRFRRELRLFEKLQVQTRILGWSENEIVLEQLIVSRSGDRKGQVAARALFTGGLYDRKARKFVPVSRMMHEIGVDQDSPQLPEEAKAFFESIERLRDLDRPAKRETVDH